MNQSSYEANQALMNEAFKLVQNPLNWKLPIDRMVELTPGQVNQVHDAVIYFTGSVPKITTSGNGLYRVVAAGYYRTIGS